MRAGTFLTDATRQLQAAGIATARLDCLVLLEDSTGQNRAHLLAHPELALSVEQQQLLTRQLTARMQHTPLAYLRGKAFFYGRLFAVNHYVLVPRPETEAMIDLLKTLPLTKPRIADIGTGSGCIAITAALELPQATTYAYDISTEALALAQENADALHSGVHFKKSDLLDDVRDDIDIILANLPYVPNAYPINKAATYEPQIALFAGDDGLDAYRTFWRQITSRAQQPAYVITESLPLQHTELTAIARSAGYSQRTLQGYVQLFERAS